jgi:hypothetical protein
MIAGVELKFGAALVAGALCVAACAQLGGLGDMVFSDRPIVSADADADLQQPDGWVGQEDVDTGSEPDVQEAGADESQEGGAQDSEAGACSIVEGANLCNAIPSFGGATQVMDGEGSEFCAIPAVRLNNQTAAALPGGPVPDTENYESLVRVAWSAEGLHLHFQVHQNSPVLALDPTAQDPWNRIANGDDIEVFAKGDTVLTGSYGGSNDLGAVQILFSPGSQSPARQSRGEIWRTGALQSLFPQDLYATRIVQGGYEVEFKLLWSTLGVPPSPAPASGTRIGFDLAAAFRNRADMDNPDAVFQLVYGFVAVQSSPCGSAVQAHPWCDDRTWCTPSLQ